MTHLLVRHMLETILKAMEKQTLFLFYLPVGILYKVQQLGC